MILIGVTAISCASLHARAGDYIRQIMPLDIKIGDSAAKVEESRRTVRRKSPTADGENYEFIEKYSNNTLGWYYIRRGILCGYMRTSRFLAKDVALKREEVDRILPGDGSGFVRQADERISRMGSGLEIIAVPAVSWRNVNSGIHLYTVLTDGEATVVIFDPSIMAPSDFFMMSDSAASTPSKITNIRRLEKVEAAADGRSNRAEIIFVIVSALILVLLIIGVKKLRNAKLGRHM